jgi:hypothetical protein
MLFEEKVKLGITFKEFTEVSGQEKDSTLVSYTIPDLCVYDPNG